MKLKLSRVAVILAGCFLSLGAQAADLFPLSGRVGEVLNADRYTYLRVDTEDGPCWVATMPSGIMPGASVVVPDGVVMKDFTSPVLDRTFKQVVFADRVESDGTVTAQNTSALPPGHPAVPRSNDPTCPVAGADTAPVSGMAGTIVETMDAGGYTYVRVEGMEKTVWAATDQFGAEVGQRVVVPEGVVMRDFKSPTLGKSFDEIYFVDHIQIVGKDSTVTTRTMTQEKPEVPSKIDPMDPPAGGITIRELFERKNDLADQDVIVRGVVTRVSENVMDTNWIHLDDGSGTDEEAADLTITSPGRFQVGQVATVRGQVVVDYDIGAHYKYDVILQDAVEVQN